MDELGQPAPEFRDIKKELRADYPQPAGLRELSADDLVWNKFRIKVACEARKFLRACLFSIIASLPAIIIQECQRRPDALLKANAGAHGRWPVSDACHDNAPKIVCEIFREGIAQFSVVCKWNVALMLTYAWSSLTESSIAMTWHPAYRCR